MGGNGDETLPTEKVDKSTLPFVPKLPSRPGAVAHVEAVWAGRVATPGRGTFGRTWRSRALFAVLRTPLLLESTSLLEESK